MRDKDKQIEDLIREKSPNASFQRVIGAHRVKKVKNNEDDEDQ